jgi:D-sedoheptulose 7-phosphate isomerase
MKESSAALIDELTLRYPELASCRLSVEAALEVLVKSYRAGGKVLVCGNGGSASDAEHICGELLKKFKKYRAVPQELV